MMTRIIQIAPGVVFAADVLDPEWIFTASGIPRPQTTSVRAKLNSARYPTSSRGADAGDVDSQIELL